jgi:hypothetical protein
MVSILSEADERDPFERAAMRDHVRIQRVS